MEIFKWKFEIQYIFSIGQNFGLIDRNDEENNLLVSGWFDRYSILVRSIEKSIWSIERNSRAIKTRKTKISVEFSSNCSECLKMFQALWAVLWNILTLHMCILMKHNSISINSNPIGLLF